MLLLAITSLSLIALLDASCGQVWFFVPQIAARFQVSKCVAQHLNNTLANATQVPAVAVALPATEAEAAAAAATEASKRLQKMS